MRTPSRSSRRVCDRLSKSWRTAVRDSRALWIAIPISIVAALVTSSMPPSVVLAAKVSGGPVMGAVSAALDSLVPGASGVFLAAVARTSEHDETPVDGDRYQRVDLTCIRASGITMPSLYLIRERGGFDLRMFIRDTIPRQPPTPPRFSIKPDDLIVGRRYWFATASDLDSRYPQGIAGCWPVESTSVAGFFERVVSEDAYRWHPETWPPGFVTGWSDDAHRPSSRVRIWRGQNPLWEKRLDGVLTHRLVEAWYLHRGHELGGSLDPPGLPDTAMVLLAEIRTQLDSANAYGLRPGPWLIQQLHDVWSGRLVASRVRADHSGDVERVYQAYDAHGRLVYERIQDFLETGGSAVGAEHEAWLRRVERWLDGRTGRQTKLEVERYVEPARGGGWLPVDQAQGLAAGPLRVSSHP